MSDIFKNNIFYQNLTKRKLIYFFIFDIWMCSMKHIYLIFIFFPLFSLQSSIWEQWRGMGTLLCFHSTPPLPLLHSIFATFIPWFYISSPPPSVKLFLKLKIYIQLQFCLFVCICPIITQEPFNFDLPKTLIGNCSCIENHGNLCSLLYKL